MDIPYKTTTKLVVIDEAQDYTLLQYKIIKKLSFFCHVFHDFIITLLENKAVFLSKKLAQWGVSLL